MNAQTQDMRVIVNWHFMGREGQIEYDDKDIKVMWDENDGWITQEDCCEDCGVKMCAENNWDCDCGDEEICGFCVECDKEGTFIGKDGDDWTCLCCLGVCSCDDCGEQEENDKTANDCAYIEYWCNDCDCQWGDCTKHLYPFEIKYDKNDVRLN
jgi:hypothetical protein